MDHATGKGLIGAVPAGLCSCIAGLRLLHFPSRMVIPDLLVVKA